MPQPPYLRQQHPHPGASAGTIPTTSITTYATHTAPHSHSSTTRPATTGTAHTPSTDRRAHLLTSDTDLGDHDHPANSTAALFRLRHSPLCPAIRPGNGPVAHPFKQPHRHPHRYTDDPPRHPQPQTSMTQPNTATAGGQTPHTRRRHNRQQTPRRTHELGKDTQAVAASQPSTQQRSRPTTGHTRLWQARERRHQPKQHIGSTTDTLTIAGAPHKVASVTDHQPGAEAATKLPKTSQAVSTTPHVVRQQTREARQPSSQSEDRRYLYEHTTATNADSTCSSWRPRRIQATPTPLSQRPQAPKQQHPTRQHPTTVTPPTRTTKLPQQPKTQLQRGTR